MTRRGRQFSRRAAPGPGAWGTEPASTRTGPRNLGYCPDLQVPGFSLKTCAAHVRPFESSAERRLSMEAISPARQEANFVADFALRPSEGDERRAATRLNAARPICKASLGRRICRLPESRPASLLRARCTIQEILSIGELGSAFARALGVVAGRLHVEQRWSVSRGRSCIGGEQDSCRADPSRAEVQ